MTSTGASQKRLLTRVREDERCTALEGPSPLAAGSAAVQAEALNDALITSVRRTADTVGPLIASMTPDDYVRPTPCPGLDVRSVTAHLSGGLSGFADVAEGKPLGFELVELLVHGWDIARSLGRKPAYDDDLVAAAPAGAQRWVNDAACVPQLFGPEVAIA